MVDVVDSKSTAGDSVPVRVRSPAPNIPQPQRGWGIFICQMGPDSNQSNAARMSAARDGLTERILYLRPFLGEDANRVRSPAPKKTVALLGSCLFYCGGGLYPGLKKCPVDTFLARGRVHGWMTAGSKPVGIHPLYWTNHAVSRAKMQIESGHRHLKSMFFAPPKPPFTQGSFWAQQADEIRKAYCTRIHYI